MDYYSSRRAMNNIIRKMERCFAKNIGDLPFLNKRDLREFESGLEWFLTWRIKLIDMNNSMWCDGASDLKLMPINGHTINLEASVRIGPESDVSIIYDGTLEGEITLSSHKKRLKSYRLKLVVNDNVYLLNK